MGRTQSSQSKNAENGAGETELKRSNNESARQQPDEVVRCRQSLREIDLINIAGTDITLGAFNGGQEFGAGKTCEWRPVSDTAG